MKVSSKLGIVICIVAGSEIIFKLISDPWTKLIFGAVSLFVVLPILAFYLKESLLAESKKNKLEDKKTNMKNTNNANAVISTSDLEKLISRLPDLPDKQKYKTKTVENENYKLIKDCFHDMMQNSQLKNPQIVNFLAVIDKQLGSHLYNYQSFDWDKKDNLAHQIYTKLKSSKFKDSDYRILYNELIRISYGLEEPEEDYFKNAKAIQ